MEYIDIIDEILISIRRIIRAVDLHSRKLEKEFNITGPQLYIINEVAKHESISIGQLARKASLSNATVTNIVQRLEGREYLKRIRNSDDKRKVFVEITSKSEELLKNAPSLFQDYFLERMEKTKPWEQTLLLSSLQRIAEMMDIEDISASAILFSLENIENKVE
ncbi:MAG: MarR family transcriptional regulator [Spirochaetales bacterium]|nr:MarR family transcriptional regulator [Spirochaetales bacterium]